MVLLDGDFHHLDVTCLVSPVGAAPISANMVLLKQFIAHSPVAKSLPGGQTNTDAQRSQRLGSEVSRAAAKEKTASPICPLFPLQLSSALVV